MNKKLSRIIAFIALLCLFATMSLFVNYFKKNIISSSITIKEDVKKYSDGKTTFVESGKVYQRIQNSQKSFETFLKSQKKTVGSIKYNHEVGIKPIENTASNEIEEKLREMPLIEDCKFETFIECKEKALKWTISVYKDDPEIIQKHSIEYKGSHMVKIMYPAHERIIFYSSSLLSPVGYLIIIKQDGKNVFYNTKSRQAAFLNSIEGLTETNESNKEVQKYLKIDIYLKQFLLAIVKIPTINLFKPIGTLGGLFDVVKRW